MVLTIALRSWQTYNMANLKCPKCDSEDIIVGNKLNQNKCEECDKKWEWEGDDATVDSLPELQQENILRFKSPHVLFTINKKFGRKLDEAFSRLF